jgi:hypothetical protein
MRWKIRPAGTRAPEHAGENSPAEGPAVDLQVPIEQLELPPAEEQRGNGTPPRPLAGWIVLVVVLGLVGGGVGLLVAAAIGMATALLGPRPRTFLRVAIGLLVLVPVVVLVRGLPPAFFVSPDFVRHNMLAQYLAGTALVLLVVGVVRDVGPALPRPPLALPPSPKEEEVLLERRKGLWGRVPVFAVGLGALTVLGLLLRLAVSSAAAPDPVSGQIASNLVGGAGFSLPGPFGVLTPTGLRMPITPALLALAQTSASPEFAGRLLWAVIGAATVTAVGVVGRRLFGVAAGLAAAAMVAALPSFFLENVRMTSATVAALIIALILLAATRPSGSAFTIPRVAIAGGLVGLLALTRPEGVLIGAVILGSWLAPRSASALSTARRTGLAVVAVAGILLVLGPWVLRNHSQFGTLLPTTETGTIAAGANAPSTYAGGLAGSFDPSAARAAVRSVSRTPLGEGALDRRLRAEAESYASGHVGGLLVALPVRMARAFDLWSPTNERAAHAARGLSAKGWLLEWITFLPLLGLAAWGCWRLRARFSGDLLPLYLAPLAVAVVALVAYGEPLARAAIDPVLALMAGAGLVALPRPARLRRPGRGRGRGQGRREGSRSRWRRHSAV